MFRINWLTKGIVVLQIRKTGKILSALHKPQMQLSPSSSYQPQFFQAVSATTPNNNKRFLEFE